MPDGEEREIPARVGSLKKAWYGYMLAWRAFHYTVGLIGALCATAVAGRPSFLVQLPSMLDAMAWTSALSIGVLTLYRPHSRANAYAAAWRVLNGACLRYAYDPDCSRERLFEAADRGEAIIQASDPSH